MNQRDEGFLSQRQAALRYGINPRTLTRRRHDGRLPAFIDPLHDRMVLYRQADVEALTQIHPVQQKPLANGPAA
jgi:helix-turn-helix, Psq domain